MVFETGDINGKSKSDWAVLPGSGDIPIQTILFQLIFCVPGSILLALCLGDIRTRTHFRGLFELLIKLLLASHWSLPFCGIRRVW